MVGLCAPVRPFGVSDFFAISCSIVFLAVRSCLFVLAFLPPTLRFCVFLHPCLCLCSFVLSCVLRCDGVRCELWVAVCCCAFTCVTVHSFFLCCVLCCVFSSSAMSTPEREDQRTVTGCLELFAGAGAVSCSVAADSGRGIVKL